MHKNTPDNIAQGLIYLLEATDRNPTDAMAWAGLALGYSAVGHGPLSTPDVWVRARAAAERAISLDPTLAEARASLANIRFPLDWDWEGAEAAFRRAHELNPSIAESRMQYAWVLLVLNRYEEARRIAAEIEAGKMTGFDAFGLAILYGALGDVEATHRWLTHEPNLVWRVSVALDPIVGIPGEVLTNPRFDEFMAQLNLPWWKE